MGSSKRKEQSSSGQVMILTLLALVVLLAFAGLAVDGASLWFHRQAAQAAADAACQAAVVDLQYLDVNGSYANPNYSALPTCSGWPTPCAGTFTCTSGSSWSPCQYAAFNGYNSAGLTSSTPNQVDVSYPTSLASGGIQTPPGIPVPFLKVVITEGVRLSVTSLIMGTTTMNIKAAATCGLTPVVVPVGILVLDPTNSIATGTGAGALEIGGTADLIQIIGGPKISIQVNSTYYAGTKGAVANNGNPTVDLSNASLTNGTCPGGSLGVSANEPNPFGTNLVLGSSGAWIQGDSPIPDPFSGVATPPKPTRVGLVTQNVPYGWHCDHATDLSCPTNTFIFCPDFKKGSKTCIRFSPGLYSKSNGNLAAINNIHDTTAIFDPGFYYIDCTGGDCGSSPGMTFGSNSLARPSGASYYPDGTPIQNDTSMNNYCGSDPGCWLMGSNNIYVGGTTFYFAGTGSITAAGNSGGGVGAIDPFYAASQTSSLAGYPTCSPLPTCAMGGGPQNSANPQPALGIQIPCSQTTSSLPTCPSFPFPASFSSHAVLGPCGAPNQPSLTWNNGTSSFQVDTNNQGRGITFFDDHSTINSGKSGPSWSGGGGMLVVGAMYFHQCTGPNSPQYCSGVPTDYNDMLSLGGSSSANTWVFGGIVADQLQMQGSPTLKLFLDLNFKSPIPKVYLIR